MMVKPIWWDWATFNEDGFLSGIDENAPEEIKKEYEKYLEEEAERKKKGIKI